MKSIIVFVICDKKYFHSFNEQIKCIFHIVDSKKINDNMLIILESDMCLYMLESMLKHAKKDKIHAKSFKTPCNGI